MIKTCSIPNCTSKHKAFNMCIFHYRRLKKYGNPNEPRKRKKSGEGNISTGGYKRITVNGKRLLEHRYVMELHLGRKLLKNEHIHHKNENPLDNSLSNLELLNSSDHKKLHLKNFWLNKSKKWSLKYNLDYCILCGRDSILHSNYGHCRSCTSLITSWAFKTKSLPH